MMSRRGGLNYIKNNFEARKVFKQSGFYNSKDFLITTVGIAATSLIPDKLRYFCLLQIVKKNSGE